MKILNILVEKGGTGKSTTVKELGAGLASKGLRVLIGDLDPQGNVTKCLLKMNDGIHRQTLEEIKASYDASSKTILDSLAVLEKYVLESPFQYDMASVLSQPNFIRQAIQKTKFKGLDLLPATHKLSESDMSLKQDLMKNPVIRLQKALDQVRDDYDVVILDNPPFSNALTYNSINACANVGDFIIVPVKIDNGGLEGLYTTTKDAINWLSNASLGYDIKFLPIMKQPNNLDRDVIDMLRYIFPDRVLQSTIKYQAKPVTKASLNGEIMVLNDFKSKVADDYRELVEEIYTLIDENK